MSKITLTNLVNLQNETTAVNAINNNNTLLTTALDNTLSRDGTTPNTMSASLDMNSNSIINLPTPASNYEPVRLIDVATINGGGITVSPLPTGGTTGQQLTKNSNTNFDTKWATNQPVIAGGNTNQVLTKTSNADFALGWTNSVTSVGVSAPADFTITNSPITTTGNIGVAWASTPTGTGSVVRQNSPTINSPSISSIVSSGSTLTLPTSVDTLVGRATTDTLTNKSIGASQLTGAIQSANFPALVGDVTVSAATLTTAIAANAVTNGQQAPMAAFTLKGNTTSGSANPTDISIPALTQKASPISGDMVMIVDSAASNALKFATVGSVASAGSVSSLGGLTGALLLGPGLTTISGTTIQDDPAMIGEVRQVAFNRVPTNFLAADGSSISRSSFALLFAQLVVSSVVNITNASPAVVTWTSNKLFNNDPILLTGTLPSGLSTATKYYVKGLSGNNFNLSLTPGGAAINTTTAGTGTFTAFNAPWEGTAIGNGTTTFTLPNLNGQFIRGVDNGASVDTNRSFGTAELDAFQGHRHSASGSVNLAVSPSVSAGGIPVVASSPSTAVTVTVLDPTTDTINGTPRTAAETRPRNQALLYVIRYQ